MASSNQEDSLYVSSTSAATTARSDAPYTDVRELVARPLREVAASAQLALSVRDFYDDMLRRDATLAHRAVLVSGGLIFLVVVGLCATALAAGAVADESLLWLLVFERAVAGGAQLIYTFRGICLENPAMLLVANLNAVALVVRCALLPSVAPVVHYGFLGALGALTLVHAGASAVAWQRDSLARIVGYCFSTAPDVQRLYRHYQLFSALTFVDLQASVMATGVVFAFLVAHHWYAYVIFVALLAVSAALRSLLRHVIRTEAAAVPFAALLPLYLLMPAAVAVAIWYNDFIVMRVTASCVASTAYAAAVFFAARLALMVSAQKCFWQFGEGLKEAFAAERSALDFVRNEKVKQTSFTSPFMDALERQRQAAEDAA
jgi:hypothetical protein